MLSQSFSEKISWQRVQFLERRYSSLRKALILLILSPGILTLFFGISLPLWFISACLAAAARIFKQLRTIATEIKTLAQGLQAEDLVFQWLSLLPREWQIERNIMVNSADIDLLVTTPQGIVIAIEVKSHKGEIRLDDNQLVRDGNFSLEGDFLEILRKRSQHLAFMRELPAITCIIVFTQAKVHVPQASIDGVFVRDLCGLIPLLHSLDTNTRKFNALRTGKNLVQVVAEERQTYKISHTEHLEQRFDAAPPPLGPLLSKLDLDPLSLPLFKVKSQICYKCNMPTIVFNWQGHTLYPEEMPPQPSPRSIKYRYCKGLKRKYWVNTCQTCGAKQGDSFLYKNKKQESDWVSLNLYQNCASIDL